MRTTILILMLTATLSWAQGLYKSSFALGEEPNYFKEQLYGNGIVDLLSTDSVIWAATGYGLSKGVYDPAGGNWKWQSFDREDYKGKGGVSAMGLMDEHTLWIATAYDTVVQGDHLPAGGGLSYTRDGGQTWTHVPQPVDSLNVNYAPTTTVIQNLAYDIAFIDSTVWIATFGGGLRRSDDMGQTWQVVTTDSLFFSSLGNLNHRVFSLLAVDDTLWVGSADGISKSPDNGASWQRFRFSAIDSNTISGNFIVALDYQPATHTIWAATIEAENPNERRGVSVSSDWGKTWHRLLLDEGFFPHNFAFYGQQVYIASDRGLYFRPAPDQDWQLLTDLHDAESGNEIFQEEYYSVAVQQWNGNAFAWLGSSDGLAWKSLTEMNDDWHIIRSFVPIRLRPKPQVYAYPSPFSPSRQLYARFVYPEGSNLQEPIKIYDFAMNPVAEIPVNAYRPKWDGKNQSGDVVASGVYFYRAKVDGKTVWGKIVIIN